MRYFSLYVNSLFCLVIVILSAVAVADATPATAGALIGRQDQCGWCRLSSHVFLLNLLCV